MDTVFQTLLVNSILQGKNAHLWKGDYLFSNVNPELSWMTRESRRDVLDKYVLREELDRSSMNYEVTDCWVASGENVDRFDIRFANISIRIYFDHDKAYMHVEFVRYLIERKEYDVTHVGAVRLLDKMHAVDEKIGRMEQEWPDIVKQCTIRAKGIELRSSAVNGYMQNKLVGRDWTYNLRTTSECIVVSLMAEGKIELTTSLTDDDDIVQKLNELLAEMAIKLEISM
ncbi:MAG: hypothetical protein MJZ13_08390 [Bacteroidales bacterium]|nr:hypothetical protein [Bacteroidales bacterium]